MSILDKKASATSVFRLDAEGRFDLTFVDHYMKNEPVAPFNGDVEQVSFIFSVNGTNKTHIEHYVVKGWYKDLVSMPWKEEFAPTDAMLSELDVSRSVFNKWSKARKLSAMFSIVKDATHGANYVVNNFTMERVEDPNSTLKCLDKLSKACAVISEDYTDQKTFSEKIKIGKLKQLSIDCELKRNPRGYLEIKRFVDIVNE